MAEFEPAFQRIIKLEGGYVNSPLDAGGETFSGISRKFNPTWPGWAVIDQLKPANPNLIGLNDAIHTNPTVTDFVRTFYHGIWNLDTVPSQEVANKLFAILVNFGSRQGTLILQKALAQLGQNVVQDGSLGAKTLAAVSQSDPIHLLQYLRAYSFIHRFHVIQTHPEQEAFLEGWAIRDAE